jgi:hypothetical protein
MFAKMTFVLKCVRILHLHMQEMGGNGSKGRPKSVTPDFLSWRRTEVRLSMKLSPPKVAENWKVARGLVFQMFVLGNEATFVPV